MCIYARQAPLLDFFCFILFSTGCFSFWFFLLHILYICSPSSSSPVFFSSSLLSVIYQNFLSSLRSKNTQSVRCFGWQSCMQCMIYVWMYWFIRIIQNFFRLFNPFWSPIRHVDLTVFLTSPLPVSLLPAEIACFFFSLRRFDRKTRIAYKE